MTHPSARPNRGRTFHPETLERRNLLSTVGLAKPIPADVQSASHLVPLKGSLEGTAVVNPATGQVTITGQGNISHLGKSTIQASHTSTVTVNPQSHVPSEVVTNGKATITAANGDQLYLTYSGTGTFNGTTGFNDTFNFQITGGTGRFTGATGEGTILGSDAPNATFPNFPFTGDIEGVISTVGSNKKG